MSIVVVCNNGHRLVARDNLIGKVARCPACGVVVKVAREEAPSDSSILRILGIGETLRNGLAQGGGASFESEMLDSPENPLPPQKKICPQCNWEIDSGYKICPKCRYYFMK
ncbi:MAG: hypothetical protein HUK22_05275 [Thermoguttaceae bacterium]|nr:hypothetical protein [Thermoguttaceae bacterium]